MHVVPTSMPFNKDGDRILWTQISSMPDEHLFIFAQHLVNSKLGKIKEAKKFQWVGGDVDWSRTFGTAPMEPPSPADAPGATAVTQLKKTTAKKRVSKNAMTSPPTAKKRAAAIKKSSKAVLLKVKGVGKRKGMATQREEDTDGELLELPESEKEVEENVGGDDGDVEMEDGGQASTSKRTRHTNLSPRSHNLRPRMSARLASKVDTPDNDDSGAESSVSGDKSGQYREEGEGEADSEVEIEEEEEEEDPLARVVKREDAQEEEDNNDNDDSAGAGSAELNGNEGLDGEPPKSGGHSRGKSGGGGELEAGDVDMEGAGGDDMEDVMPYAYRPDNTPLDVDPPLMEFERTNFALNLPGYMSAADENKVVPAFDGHAVCFHLPKTPLV